jgi:hypothetical protein
MRISAFFTDGISLFFMGMFAISAVFNKHIRDKREIEMNTVL